MLRLVLDTNVWLDWLLFEDKDVLPVRNAVALKEAEVFIDAACMAELERALGYPFGKKTLPAEKQQACLAQCRRLANRIENRISEGERRGLPQCRDPDDQKILELALAARADVLVTKDRALLELNRRRTRPVPFRIAAPNSVLAP